MQIRLLEKYILEHTGIKLSDAKRQMMAYQLRERMHRLKLPSVDAYLGVVHRNSREQSALINLVTVNETYFFREMHHFDFLNHRISKEYAGRGVRVWSAASSVGAEAYSIAMQLASDNIAHEVIGSDINSEVIQKAALGLYPLSWADRVPQKMKKKYCLRGKGPRQGWFMVNRHLAENVRFLKKNLLHRHSDMGRFDIIFLRNVLLYFDRSTKIRVLNHALGNLKMNGYLFTSRTEHIFDLGIQGIQLIEHSIYQKVA